MAALAFEPRASHIISKYSATESHAQLLGSYFKIYFFEIWQI
jgi:hypothetical protein